MAGGILKSFLISVAYEVDRSSEQRFASSVEKATLAVTAMGAALAASATAVVVGVEKMSERFERLYYAGQRTAGTVANIKAMSFAVGQLGGNAEEALGSFESFAKHLRETPGAFQQLGKLGVTLTDSNGKMRDMVRIYQDFAVQLEKMPYYTRLQYAGQYGVSENSLRAMEDPQYLKFFDQYRQKMREAGLDPDSAARHAVQYMNTQRGLWTTVNAIYDTVFDHISTKLQKPMEDFDAWLQSHSGEITGFFNNLSDRISSALGHIWEIVKPYAKEFIDWITDKQTWAGLNAALDKLGRPETWKGFADAVHGLVADLKYMLSLIKAAVAALQGYFGGGDQGKQGQNYHDLYNPPEGSDSRLPGGSGGVGMRRDRNTNIDQDFRDDGKGNHAAIAGKTFGNKAPGIMARLKADFGLDDDSAAAVLGNLGHESAGFTAFNEGGGGPGRGWAQWTDPGRKARFYAYAQQNHLDPKSDEANYGFLKWELQHTHKGAIEAVKAARGLTAKTVAFEGQFEGAGVKAYGSRVAYANAALRAAHAAAVAKAAQGVAKGAAAPPVAPSPYGGLPNRNSFAPLGHSTTSSKVSNIHAPTTVHVDVSGASDPSTTAKAIGKHLQNQQGILVRQMHSAIA